MNNRILGEYEPGTFFLRYHLKNIPYESDLYNPSSIGCTDGFAIYGDKSKGGFMKTERILTFLHEATHYIHDLSLSACYFSDYLKDEIAGTTKIITQSSDKLIFPLCKQENIAHNYKSLDEYHKNIFSILIDRVKLFDFIFSEEHYVESDLGMTYKDLLEGYAHYKSIIDLLNRVIRSGQENYEYCREFKNRFDLFPYFYNDNKIDFTKALSESNYAYHIAKYFYMKSSCFNWEEYFVSLEKIWPDNFYNGGIIGIVEIGFIFLLDISLSIPSNDFVINKLEKNENQKEDFSPVHRFQIILEIIKKNGGFPDKIEGELFYKTLFNFIAQKAGWPNYDQTMYSWHLFLNWKIKTTGDISAGYRNRLLNYKTNYLENYIFNSPDTICRNSLIPILYLVRGGGMKIIKLINNMNVPFEGVFSVYELFKRLHFTWIENTEDREVDLNLECNYVDSFLRETIFRSICRNIQESILYEDSFTCFFYNDEFCEFFNSPKEDKQYNEKLPPRLICYSMDKCKCTKIKRLKDLPDKECAVKEYMEKMNYDIDTIKW